MKNKATQCLAFQPEGGITDYTMTCYDKLESNEHSGEAASLTRRDLSCSLLRHFYVISDIRYIGVLYVITDTSLNFGFD